MIKMDLLIIAVRSKILTNLFLPRISVGKFRECSHFKENHYSTSVLLIKGIVKILKQGKICVTITSL